MEIVRPAWGGLCSSPLIAQSWRHPLFMCKPSPFHSSSSRSSSSSSASNGPVEGGSSQQESRSSILRRLDLELAAGNEMQALSLVASAELRGFGNAAQVPQRLYSIADLRLNDIEASRLLSPVDSTLGDVRRNLQIAAAFGSIVLWQTLQPSQIQALLAFLALLVISGIDLVAYNGGVEALFLDTIGRSLSEKYKSRVAQHEAGHFLIAYLLGILPKNYTLSSLDAYRKGGSLNVQAGTTFVDTEFQDEVKSGKLSAGSLNKYSCIALAGVATEYLLFGVAEGGLADIQQLDRLLKSLNFTQMKADSQVRWAVLNVITILQRHRNVLSKLASAMLSNKSVECKEKIVGLEKSLNTIRRKQTKLGCRQRQIWLKNIENLKRGGGGCSKWIQGVRSLLQQPDDKEQRDVLRVSQQYSDVLPPMVVGNIFEEKRFKKAKKQCLNTFLKSSCLGSEEV